MTDDRSISSRLCLSWNMQKAFLPKLQIVNKSNVTNINHSEISVLAG